MNKQRNKIEFIYKRSKTQGLYIMHVWGKQLIVQNFFWKMGLLLILKIRFLFKAYFIYLMQNLFEVWQYRITYSHSKQ